LSNRRKQFQTEKFLSDVINSEVHLLRSAFSSRAS